jgi:hypothetical protein
MDYDDFPERRTNGDVCGVGNCTSRLWLSNGDGTVSCENGHVRAGYAFGDDEPEADYVGVNLRTTRKRKEKVLRENLGA